MATNYSLIDNLRRNGFPLYTTWELSRIQILLRPQACSSHVSFIPRIQSSRSRRLRHYCNVSIRRISSSLKSHLRLCHPTGIRHTSDYTLAHPRSPAPRIPRILVFEFPLLLMPLLPDLDLSLLVMIHRRIPRQSRCPAGGVRGHFVDSMAPISALSPYAKNT